MSLNLLPQHKIYSVSRVLKTKMEDLQEKDYYEKIIKLLNYMESYCMAGKHWDTKSWSVYDQQVQPTMLRDGTIDSRMLWTTPFSCTYFNWYEKAKLLPLNMRIITTHQNSWNPSPTSFKVKLKSLWYIWLSDPRHHCLDMLLEECAIPCSERETHFLNQNVEDVRQTNDQI